MTDADHSPEGSPSPPEPDGAQAQDAPPPRHEPPPDYPYQRSRTQPSIPPGNFPAPPPASGVRYGRDGRPVVEPPTAPRQQWHTAPGWDAPPPDPAQRMPGPPSAEQRHPPAPIAPGDVNYADSFRVSDLVPTRTVPPGGGWRRAVYRATFGLVNLGRSPAELRQAELEAKIRTPLRGSFKIGVLGKGGVGKTTVSAAVGSILAELRQDDRVVAIDADTAFGKLGARVDPRTPGSYWELTADQHLNTFADIRTRVGSNDVGLFVLPGESSTARRRVLDPAIFREATARLDRHFTISIVDCGSSLDAEVTREALRDINALIVVSSPWVDGASAAGQTMEWLANRGWLGLLARTTVVLNDSDGHATKKTRSILVQQFSSRGQVVIEVPFDSQLAPGRGRRCRQRDGSAYPPRLLRSGGGRRRTLLRHHRRAARSARAVSAEGGSVRTVCGGQVRILPGGTHAISAVGSARTVVCIVTSLTGYRAARVKAAASGVSRKTL